jgi:hypothetical protein
MGHQRRLGRPFERTCRLSRCPRALQCSSEIQGKRHAGHAGHNPKEKLQVETRRKAISYYPFRIQALKKLDFEWKPTFRPRQGTPKKPSVDNDTTRVRERAVKSPKHAQQPSLKKTTLVKKSAGAIKSKSRTKPNKPTEMAKSTSTSSRLGQQNTRHVSDSRRCRI